MSTLVAAALALLASFSVLWVVSLLFGDASIVDIWWGSAFVLVAWVTFVIGDAPFERRLPLLIVVTAWGLRLTGYLAWRNIGSGEDRRYQSMRRRWGEGFWWKSLVRIYLLQGALAWIVSLPVQVGMDAQGGDTFFPTIVVGMIVVAVGLAFESIGDWQLARFKSDPANEGKVLDTGLWRYTRHPNYFGDAVVWWGIWLTSLGTIDPWWTAIGPIVMTILLLRVSGVALLERSISKRRPEYEDYIRRTNAFFPGPPSA